MRRRKSYWKPALACAVAFHVAMGFFVGFAGDLWGRLHPMPPVYTVRIFEVREPAPPKKVVRPKRPRVHTPKKAKKKVVKKKEKKKEAAHRPKKRVKKSIPDKKVVSTRPKKSKKKEKPKPAPKEVKSKEHPKKDLDRLLQERLKALAKKVEEKRAEERLEERIKELMAAKRAGKSRSGSVGSPGDRAEANPVLKMYLARVYEEIRRRWVLPEQLLSSSSLEAVIVIRVMPDGTVAKSWFEHRSGLSLFDNSAMRAVKEAAPLPPMPKALGGAPLEIGIRFRPGDIGLS